jgi:hypothetical protein
VPRGLNSCFPEDGQSKQPQAGKRHTDSTSQEGSASTKKKGRVHLQGVLVEGGAECQRFRSSDNRYYTLEGNLRGFHTGENVEITGRLPQASHCMQDTTIRVETIRRAKTPGAHIHQPVKKPATTK